MSGDDLEDGLVYELPVESDNEPESNTPEHKSEPEKFTQTSKKRKKKSKNSSYAQDKINLAKYSPEMLADFVLARLRHIHPNLTSLELAELSVSKNSFVDTSSFPLDRNSLVNLGLFCEKFLKNSSFVVILSISALRACHVHRATKNLPGKGLKLIAKNSVEMDQKALSIKKVHKYAASTPGRILRLLTDSVLDPTRVDSVLVDSSHLDQKLQNVWDLKETIPCLVQLASASQRPKIYIF